MDGGGKYYVMDSSMFSWGLAEEKGVQLRMCCLLLPQPFCAASGQGNRAAAGAAGPVAPAASRLSGLESSLLLCCTGSGDSCPCFQ